MNLSGAVDGDTYKEVVLPEEFRPFRVEQYSVGLDSVVDLLSTGIFLL